ncbi:glycosyltransferase family 4 protein [Streptomyces sp. NPDC094034]|uniref:glycosyltransferase family 4 protein n=1 Tax=Streptomyces sp. NPDC094034 TaxID=3155309 RepID=UPI00332836C8
MSIAVVAPPWFTVPPKGYGGTETVCANLVDGLVARGHRVTLIAAGKSGTTAEQYSSYDAPQSDRINDAIVEAYHAAVAEEVIADGDFDVVHDHTLSGSVLARNRSIPTLCTLHWDIADDYLQYFQLVSRTVGMVSLSKAHQAATPGVNWRGFVHNGIRTKDFPFLDRDAKEDWVLYLGRAFYNKGMHTAIDAARAAGKRIVLAAKCNEPLERAFFEDEIRPRLGSDTEWLGEVDSIAKLDLLARASCLVNPIDWEEPFGLVMAEAQACGTPVVTYDRGAAGELVESGVTGFVCQTFDELVASIDATTSLSPASCRDRAVRSFDIDVMAAGYERLYREAIDNWPPKSANR